MRLISIIILICSLWSVGSLAMYPQASFDEEKFLADYYGGRDLVGSYHRMNGFKRNDYSFLDIVNEDGQTLMHRAVEKGNLGVQRTLADCGILVNSQDKDGNTPLHYALNLQEGDRAASVVHLVKVLYANPKIKNKAGESPLDIAKRNEWTDIATILINYSLGF